jgi:hypothetical protein
MARTTFVLRSDAKGLSAISGLILRRHVRARASAPRRKRPLKICQVLPQGLGHGPQVRRPVKQNFNRCVSGGGLAITAT